MGLKPLFSSMRVLVAMRSNEGFDTIDTIAQAVDIHPALSEVVARAAYDIRRKIQKDTELNLS